MTKKGGVLTPEQERLLQNGVGVTGEGVWIRREGVFGPLSKAWPMALISPDATWAGARPGRGKLASHGVPGPGPWRRRDWGRGA